MFVPSDQDFITNVSMLYSKCFMDNKQEHFVNIPNYFDNGKTPVGLHVQIYPAQGSIKESSS